MDGALHRVGHVPRFRFNARLGRGARFAADPEPLFANLRDEHFERGAEDRREVAVGHAVPQEILRLANLVPELARDAELHFVRGLGNGHDRMRQRSRLRNEREGLRLWQPADHRRRRWPRRDSRDELGDLVLGAAGRFRE